jgi:hypothetical protein
MERAASGNTASGRLGPGRHGKGGLVGVVLTLAACLLAACSSPAPSASGSPQHTSTTGTSSGSRTTAPTTTLPVPSTSGPLQISASLSLPIAANVQITSAEAPDGAVFAAPESHDNPTPTVVWVIDNDSPAAIAEHINGGVSALAADATNLYVVSNDSVLGFTRSTGNAMGQWSLPPIDTANTSNADLVSMSATNGTVLVMIARGNLEDIYRITATSTAAPRLIAAGTSAAFGPGGSVYYERSDDHLVELSASGVTTVGPLLPNAPNGLGGGIANVVAVAGGLVWVSEPAGQGLDTTFSPYNATTLVAMGTYPGSVSEQIVDTAAGPLVLAGPDGPGNCPQGPTAAAISCVFRISPAAALTDPTGVGTADQLLGPDPAVVASDPNSSDLLLERLS